VDWGWWILKLKPLRSVETSGSTDSTIQLTCQVNCVFSHSVSLSVADGIPAQSLFPLVAYLVCFVWSVFCLFTSNEYPYFARDGGRQRHKYFAELCDVVTGLMFRKSGNTN
jgi:hypothetical protein